MPAVIVIPSNQALPEGSSGTLSATIKDDAGASIDTSAVTATAATLHDHKGAVVNTRNAQDVYGVNGGSWASGGVFTLLLTPADTQVVSGPEFQLRKLGLIVTHSSGKKAPQEIWFYVRRLSTI
jgi:hypothetical protein